LVDPNLIGGKNRRGRVVQGGRSSKIALPCGFFGQSYRREVDVASRTKWLKVA
jgi:hypothetical protein